jgi:hypothetical protein
MIWFMVLQIVSMLVELVQLRHKSEGEKDLEILLSCAGIVSWCAANGRIGGRIVGTSAN